MWGWVHDVIYFWVNSLFGLYHMIFHSSWTRSFGFDRTQRIHDRIHLFPPLSSSGVLCCVTPAILQVCLSDSRTCVLSLGWSLMSEGLVDFYQPFLYIIYLIWWLNDTQYSLTVPNPQFLSVKRTFPSSNSFLALLNQEGRQAVIEVVIIQRGSSLLSIPFLSLFSPSVPHSGAVSSIRPESPIDSIILWMRSRLCQLKPSAVVEDVPSNPLCLVSEAFVSLTLSAWDTTALAVFPKDLTLIYLPPCKN